MLRHTSYFILSIRRIFKVDYVFPIVGVQLYGFSKVESPYQICRVCLCALTNGVVKSEEDLHKNKTAYKRGEEETDIATSDNV